MESTLPSAARLAVPGDEHNQLDALVGLWRAHMTLYPAPGADAIEAEISGERRWLIDGRYLQEELAGDLMGGPYSRTGILTFHRLNRRFEMFTLDNLDTGFMPYESRDVRQGASLDRIELFGHFIYGGDGEEVTGEHVRTRYVIELPSADTPNEHAVEMHFAFPAAAEFLFCRFDFERR